MQSFRLLLLVAFFHTTLTNSATADSRAKVEKARQLFVDGQKAYDAGKLHIAEQKLNQAYRLTGAPEMAFNLARVYERMGEAKPAIKLFQDYLKKAKPEEKEQENIQQRIEQLKALDKRQQDQIFAAPPSRNQLTAEAKRFFVSGVTMFQKKRYEAAMQAFTAAHRFSPTAEVLYNLGVTCEKLGHHSEAIDYYREYMRTEKGKREKKSIQVKIAQLRELGG